jgi:hypothetical protein
MCNDEIRHQIRVRSYYEENSRSGVFPWSRAAGHQPRGASTRSLQIQGCEHRGNRHSPLPILHLKTWDYRKEWRTYTHLPFRQDRLQDLRPRMECRQVV